MTWVRWVPEPDDPPSRSGYPEPTCTLSVAPDVHAASTNYTLTSQTGREVASVTVAHRDIETHRSEAAVAVLPILAGQSHHFMDDAVLLGEYDTWTLLAYHLPERVGISAYNDVAGECRHLGVVPALQLAEALRSQAVSLAQATDPGDVFGRYLGDADAALDQYRRTGGLDGFQFERSNAAVDAFLFTNQPSASDPRTGAVVQEDDMLESRVESLIASDDDSLVRKRYIDLIYYHDASFVRTQTLDVLLEHPDERATDALWLHVHDVSRGGDEETRAVLGLLSAVSSAAAAPRLARTIRGSVPQRENTMDLIESCGAVGGPLMGAGLEILAEWLETGQWDPTPRDEFLSTVERATADATE